MIMLKKIRQDDFLFPFSTILFSLFFQKKKKRKLEEEEATTVVVDSPPSAKKSKKKNSVKSLDSNQTPSKIFDDTDWGELDNANIKTTPNQLPLP